MNIIKNQDGAAAVEFAIVAPLLFVLLFGIIEFSALLYNQAVITNASREAARYSATFYANPATGGTATRPELCSDIQNHVVTYVHTYMLDFTKQSNVTVTCPNGKPSFDEGLLAGYVSTIRIEYDYEFLVFGNLITLLGADKWSSIPLSAETAMRDEFQGS